MAEFGLQMPQMPDFTFQAPDVGGMALDGFYAAQDNERANQNAGLLQNADRRQDVRLGMDQQDAAMRQTQFTQEQQDRVAMITRAKEAQAAFAEFYDKIDDGTASAADIAQLTAAYPELSESVKQTMDGLAQEQKATYSGLIFQSASALKLGKPEMAAKLFEDYAAAAENSGQTDVAALSRAMAETARQDPAAALGTLGVFAQSLDPEINTAVFGEGKAEGPLSPQGKLKADLDAGRITQAQFDEASKPSQPLVNVNTGSNSEIGTIPQGYELVTDPTTGARSMRPIQGGPEDMSAKTAAREDSAVANASIVKESIAQARTLAVNEDGFFPSTGLVGKRLREVGGTAANDLRSSIESITGNIAFDRLQKMREESPTGGALGAVSDTEMRLLSSTIASLDQSTTRELFLTNLARVEAVYDDIIRKFSAYPAAGSPGSQPSTAAVPAQSRADELLKKHGGSP
jgi:hypothetical protein